MAMLQIVTANGKITVEVPPGTILRDVSELRNFMDFPCGGKRKCMRCRVRCEGALSSLGEEEHSALTPAEAAQGIRLACFARVTGDATIYPEKNDMAQIAVNRQGCAYQKNPLFKCYGAAVDIGTTTVCLKLLDNTGVIESRAKKNRQTAFGADVISRIEKAIAGNGKELQDAVVRTIHDLLPEAAGAQSLSSDDIDTLVITGNTTMLHLLTGRDVMPLSRAPFHADWHADEWVKGILPMLPDSADIYLPPCPSAFVGADVMTAVLASGMYESSHTSMLIDMGTNGEIALWHEGILHTCSTAAGPAFEGAELSCGVYAVSGAIDKVSLDGEGFSFTTINNAPPCGICGSGIIDALATFLELETLSETGYMKNSFVPLTGEIGVSREDVRKIQLAKSAMRAGLETLRRQVGLEWSAVDSLYVAGGFGSYLNLQSAAKIGLIPMEMLSKTRVIGNAALEGAVMCLENKDFVEIIQKIAGTAKSVALDGNPVFTELYMEHMMFE